MFAAAEHHQSLKQTDKIEIAVQFLNDVHGKYDEPTLRRYLITRKLSVRQVNEALRIHKKQVRELGQLNCKNSPSISSEKLKSFKSVGQHTKLNSKSGKMISSSYVWNDMTVIPGLPFLEEGKKDVGKKLRDDFLASELTYCDLLECLTEYYMKLSDVAKQRKVKITFMETKELFEKIPRLLDFHRRFYKDLVKGKEVGNMFLGSFRFFKGYLNYLKSLPSIIKQLAVYVGDEVLQKYLKQLRKNSTCRNYSIVGLLVVPLDRISQYKSFLNSLIDIGDTSHKSYRSLRKATRRICRVTSYIEKYRFVIDNLQDLYNVQEYLGGSVLVFTDKRKVIRRGMMFRRTTSWPRRNKLYIFFLFNDILMWTTRGGTFQNAVSIYSCKLLTWENTTNPERKFKVISKRDGQSKILFLECTSEQSKNDWCTLLKMAIDDQDKLGEVEEIDLQSVIKYEDSDDETVGHLKEMPKGNIVGRRISRANRDSMFFSDILKTPGETNSNKTEVDKKQASYQEESHYDYESSLNLTVGDIEGFDDNSSRISESDRSYLHTNNGSSTSRMSSLKLYSSSQLPLSIEKELEVALGTAQNPINGSQCMFSVDRSSSGSKKIGKGNKQTGAENSCKEFKIIRPFGRDLTGIHNRFPLTSPTFTISLGDF